MSAPRQHRKPDPRQGKHRRLDRPPLARALRNQYDHDLGRVHALLNDEEKRGLFGTPRNDGRRTPVAALAHAALEIAAWPTSMDSGEGCYAGQAKLATVANMGHRTAARHMPALVASGTECLRFTVRLATQQATIIEPMLCGIPIHPRAPGYDTEKLADARAVHDICHGAPETITGMPSPAPQNVTSDEADARAYCIAVAGMAFEDLPGWTDADVERRERFVGMLTEARVGQYDWMDRRTILRDWDDTTFATPDDDD